MIQTWLHPSSFFRQTERGAFSTEMRRKKVILYKIPCKKRGFFSQNYVPVMSRRYWEKSIYVQQRLFYSMYIKCEFIRNWVFFSIKLDWAAENHDENIRIQAIFLSFSLLFLLSLFFFRLFGHGFGNFFRLWSFNVRVWKSIEFMFNHTNARVYLTLTFPGGKKKDFMIKARDQLMLCLIANVQY